MKQQEKTDHLSCIRITSGILFLTVDGGWSSWTNWTSCFVKCYRLPCSELCGSQRVRQRFCNTPIPWQGGNYCFGNSRQQEACNNNFTTSSLTGEASHILRVAIYVANTARKYLNQYGLECCMYIYIHTCIVSQLAM